MKKPNARRLLESLRSARQEVQSQCELVTQAAAQEPVTENLHQWFKEKWVRFGPDGKIRGDCARGSSKEGKPKCLPQSKAHALGKKGRASAAAKKRRQDPNPERRGAAINVATKKKTSESKLDEKCWDTHRQAGMKRKGDRMVPNCVPRESQEQCPECGGEMYPDTMILEKQDACYYKVKSRYKVWPSAYASGALVQCRKKGAKNWGKKTKGVAEGMSWSALDEGLSVEDKIIIFEEYMTKGNLTESLEHDKRDYFISLFKMSSTPVKDKKYIVVPLSLVGNKIMQLDAPAIMKFVGHGHDGLVFNSPNGEKTYPSKIMRDLSAFNTFTFRSQSLYDKFRTALSLKFNVSLPLVGQGKQGVAEGLNEFANDDFDDRPKFIPWHDFIKGVKGIVGKEFEVVEKVVKSTIQDRFVPHDAMEFGPTMLYSYYEARAGRNKGAVSTRGAIQIGKYVPNTSKLGTRNFITSFNILKGHPFERHFDLTPENISKIASIILGNTEGAYQMQPQGVAEDQLAEKWSEKYKKSINCNNPRGFSQRAHCAGRKKNEAANPAQQSAIAIAIKQAGKKPKQAVAEAHINQQMALYKPDGTTYRRQDMPTLDPEDPAHKAVRFGPEHEQSYEQDFDKQELKRVAARAIDSLPKIQRVVLIMRLWHDLTLEQIGKRLGLSKARIRQIERQALIQISRDDLKTFAQESHVKSPAVLEADDDDAVASNAALISGPGTTDTASPKPTATPMAAPTATAQPTATAATPMAAPTVTAQPKPTATPSGSADIMALQNKLIAAGEKIKADGIMGPRTQAALSRYNARPTTAPVATAQPKPAASTPAPATAQPAVPTNAVQSGSGTPIRTGSGGYVVSPDSTPAANTATTDTTPAASSYDHNLMLASIKNRESGGDPNAVSRVGAVGTMQTMPNTLKNPGYGVKPARDNSPQELERVGRDYYGAMLKNYSDPKVALAAYNWGPGNVNKWLKQGGDFNKLPGETRAYVKNIMGDYQAAQTAQATKMAGGTRPPVSETRGKDQDQFGGMHQDDFQAKLQRLKQLVQAGPLKTVRDPLTGRTRNVPVKPKQS
jgi:RNA polymerase sigma factor (sigma-70 family)